MRIAFFGVSDKAVRAPQAEAILSEDPARPQDRWDLQVLVQVASDPELKDENFEPTESKIYRHPTFYDIPEDVGPI